MVKKLGTDKVVDIRWRGAEVAADTAKVARRALRSAMGVIRGRFWVNLSRISSSSKWKWPGGFGWWKLRIPHGFLKKSLSVGDYETRTKDQGAYLRMTSIMYPVEYGSKRSEARPFLKPAVRDSAAIVRAAMKKGGR